MSEDVDFVITWVDNNDPSWLKKKNLFLKKNNEQNFNNNNSSIRYRDYGTLKYVFRSIEKFAPWFNKIYLITDKQIPKWLATDNPNVIIVDHSIIIPHKYLPVFNSNAIEWNIDNIPNLSENFVYFNDDTILNKPVKKENFFINGEPCDFRLYTDIVPLDDFDHIPLNNNILINKYIKGNWPLSKNGLFNFKYGLKLVKEFPFILQAKKRGVTGYKDPHGPQSYVKSTFKKAKKIWSSEIERTLRNRFRKENDISIWLVRHLQLETGKFIPIKPNQNITFSIEEVKEIKNVLNHNKFRSICINDDDVSNYKELFQKINNLLLQKFPEKSKFEK